MPVPVMGNRAPRIHVERARSSIDWGMWGLWAVCGFLALLFVGWVESMKPLDAIVFLLMFIAYILIVK